MTTPNPGAEKSVERLFPFVLRSRILLVGRDTLAHSRRKLHFILLTTDLSENSRDSILRDFAPYPIVQCFTSEDISRCFNLNGTKVVGFAKSSLAQSIYAELKHHRINKPVKTGETTPVKAAHATARGRRPPTERGAA